MLAAASDWPASSLRRHGGAALVALHRTPGVSVIPQEDQKVLTAEDRAAAVLALLEVVGLDRETGGAQRGQGGGDAAHFFTSIVCRPLFTHSNRISSLLRK